MLLFLLCDDSTLEMSPFSKLPDWNHLLCLVSEMRKLIIVNHLLNWTYCIDDMVKNLAQSAPKTELPILQRSLQLLTNGSYIILHPHVNFALSSNKNNQPWEFYNDINEKLSTTINSFENYIQEFNLKNNHAVDYLSSVFIQTEAVNGDQEHLVAKIISLIALGLMCLTHILLVYSAVVTYVLVEIWSRSFLSLFLSLTVFFVLDHCQTEIVCLFMHLCHWEITYKSMNVGFSQVLRYM